MQVDEDEVTETKTNHFDNLPSLAPPKTDSFRDELDRYLDGDPKATEDVIAWWYDKIKSFPCLYRMALDYLTIPATSTDVERIFSQGRLMLPYVRNRLKVQTTHSLMCFGPWSRLGMIHDDDVKAVVLLDEVPLEQGDKDGDIEMPEVLCISRTLRDLTTFCASRHLSRSRSSGDRILVGQGWVEKFSSRVSRAIP
ncbi:hypothetical protein D9758_005494 [Tetrapyrgos nigripes]|uniref:HAT C-terminal dimerisation domain-containing protein n=1 Tax=Tetrapyrgos nigripes TaxID=182062 RepID=A0A8H5GIG2_9AGAR|nr:hypothetical protein D9758_005494 [Tetrapyrgos nigripes]